MCKGNTDEGSLFACYLCMHNYSVYQKNAQMWLVLWANALFCSPSKFTHRRWMRSIGASQKYYLFSLVEAQEFISVLKKSVVYYMKTYPLRMKAKCKILRQMRVCQRAV